MAEMTAETKAFFAREDVRALVDGLRADGCFRFACDVNRAGPGGYVGGQRADGTFTWRGVHPGALNFDWMTWELELKGRTDWWGYMFHEGRALIEEPCAHRFNTFGQHCDICGASHKEILVRDEAGGSTREDERATKGEASPSVAPSTPAPSRPVCSRCEQTVWRDSLDYEGAPICSDCVGDMTTALMGVADREDLDTRIAAARKADPDPTDEWRAWATPSAEGVEW